MFKKYGPYIGFSAIALGAGGVSAMVSQSAMRQVYDSLRRPPLAPPGWVFPAAWTILYILMGVSAGIVWKKSSGSARSGAMRLWGVQLFVNALWTVIYFDFEARLVSFLWLLLLLGLVIAMTDRFGKISGAAGKLNWPYIAWLCFAAYLNLGTYLLNG
jgi:benzodiazapine receptor